MKPPKTTLDSIKQIQSALDANPAFKATQTLPKVPSELQQAIEATSKIADLVAPSIAMAKVLPNADNMFGIPFPSVQKTLDELSSSLDLHESQYLRIAQHFAKHSAFFEAARAADAVGSIFREFRQNIISDSVQAYDFFKESQDRLDRTNRVEAIGYLPHDVFPWALMEKDDEDEDKLMSEVESYYVENWSEVGSQLQARVQSYSLDDETKATFGEALDAHGHGLYRVAPRLLFPEIERAVRLKFNDGKFEKGHTSQRQLRNWINDQPIGRVLIADYAGSLLYKFLDDLYARAETEDQIALVVVDPVPNRHAACHGLVPYNTHRHSLNSIIMTEFIFELFEAIVPASRPDGEAA